MPPKRKVIWSWRDDSGGFKPFAVADEKQLEAAYLGAGGSGKVKLVLGSPYEYNFDAMTQRNLESNKLRDIQRSDDAVQLKKVSSKKPVEEDEEEDSAVDAPPPPPTDVVWEWFDDSNKPKPYTPDVEQELEKGYLANPKSSKTVTIKGTKYRVDFAEMTQTNLTTNGPRNIQRKVGGVVTAGGPAKKSAPAPPPPPPPPPTPTPKSKRDREDEMPQDVSGAKSVKAVTSQGKAMKVVKKGRGVVDVHSGMSATTHVYEEGKDVYQCTLNQTNIGTNNNKFYVLQLLEDDSSKKYWVWTRWARVGQIGQSKLDPYPTLAGAKHGFCQKFREKTQNAWDNRENFTKVAGKYHYMEMDYGDDDDDAGSADDDDDDTTTSKKVIPSSALSPELQQLMKKISNKLDMEKTMKELEVDTKKMPLGKVSKKQIKEAFGYLKQIEAELGKKHPDGSTLVDLTSMFYTLIPHDFGMMKPPAIRDTELLKRKMHLVDTLADLEIATKLLEESKHSGKNPLDAAYESMRCKIVPLDKSSADYARIVQLVKGTHGKTHTAYTLSVSAIFEIERQGEKTAYESTYSSLHNKHMMFHGSRMTNFMGILSQGLRIAPPEAPVTGYMFGKGVYFADVSSKSANYCCSSPTNPEGLLLLCEVALGNTNDLTEAKYMDAPPKGTHSTFGMGKMQPDPKSQVNVDGVTWSMGPVVDNPAVKSTALLYNEFIVYDVKQLMMKYAVLLDFHYKK